MVLSESILHGYGKDMLLGSDDCGGTLMGSVRDFLVEIISLMRLFPGLMTWILERLRWEGTKWIRFVQEISMSVSTVTLSEEDCENLLFRIMFFLGTEISPMKTADSISREALSFLESVEEPTTVDTNNVFSRFHEHVHECYMERVERIILKVLGEDGVKRFREFIKDRIALMEEET